jgi:hypothetical protein
VNRHTNKKISKECLPACTWKKILLIALESPELCSTLATIKELVNRRHKNLSQWKTLKKGKSKDQKSCCMATMVGSLYSAQLPKENSEIASLMVFKVLVVEAHFFQSTMDQIQYLSGPPGV